MDICRNILLKDENKIKVIKHLWFLHNVTRTHVMYKMPAMSDQTISDNSTDDFRQSWYLIVSGHLRF